jgi:histidinol phosphatase-like PHP family hydrolase
MTTNCLIIDHKYIIYKDIDDKFLNYTIGTFKGHHFKQKHIFVDVRKREIEFIESGRYLSLYHYDLLLLENDKYIYHDIEKVKENAKKAIQNMEKRALTQILGRLVNEQFEW